MQSMLCPLNHRKWVNNIKSTIITRAQRHDKILRLKKANPIWMNNTKSCSMIHSNLEEKGFRTNIGTQKSNI